MFRSNFRNGTRLLSDLPTKYQLINLGISFMMFLRIVFTYLCRIFLYETSGETKCEW